MVMASKTFSSQLSIHQLAFSKKDVVIGLPKLKYVKNQLCSSCEVGKAKQCSFNSKIVPSSKGRLNLLHMDLCGPMRLPSINWEEIYVCKAFSYAYGGILHSVQEDIRVYNKRTRLIVESIHLRFDEIKEMFEKSIANYDFRHRSSKTTKGGTINMGLWYPKGSGFELTAFSNADHAGCVDTRKSTSGGIQFLVEESLNLTFDESPPPTKLPPLVDDDVGEEEAIRNNIKVVNNIVKNKSKKID
ncbi:integrase, catalytic region, zinc finger, CCHC-type containing protein [Tanacetum coccineum]